MTISFKICVIACLAALSMSGCNGQGFKGDPSTPPPDQVSSPPVPIPGGTTADQNPVPPVVNTGPAMSQPDAPQGLPVVNGIPLITPDYQACKASATRKISYPARCPSNEVAVIINDGSAQEMSCCPLAGSGILSTNPAEQYSLRTGRCEPDEVGVGMVSSATSAIFCTKYNASYVTTAGVVQAQLTKARTVSSPEMRAIVESYNLNDTCVCPQGTILVGSHSQKDNTCTDQCVSLKLR